MHGVSIRARHHWRAIRFAANIAQINIFSRPAREPLLSPIWNEADLHTEKKKFI